MPHSLVQKPLSNAGAEGTSTHPQVSETQSLGALNSGASQFPQHPVVKPEPPFVPPPPTHPLGGKVNTSTTRIHATSRTEESKGEAEVSDTEERNDKDPRADIPTTGREEEYSLPTPVEDPAEEELSEEQLRKLFEDEEIERFLSHFNAHVQEVRLPATNTPAGVLATAPPIIPASGGSQRNALSPGAENSPFVTMKTELDLNEPGDNDDSAWSMIDRSYQDSTNGRGTDEISSPPRSSGPLTLSEKIARTYILPKLPPLQPNPDHRFTIGRARLQAERFNLVTQPVYGPFFARLWRYASWKDRRTSAWYCAVFWTLWLFNLLLPSLFAIILYTLFRRRIFSYPTLKELRDRRHEAARAEALGEEVEKRFATGPDFGMRDAWNLFRSVTKGKKKRLNKKIKTGTLDQAGAKANNSPGRVQIPVKEGEEIAVKIDVQGESQAEKDTKRAILQAMTEIADLHERIKNIFLWRRPHASKNYAMVLTLLFCITLILPAKYLAKLTYFVGGVFFWFVSPVIMGLPPGDRARFPPAFADSPTDAQYAMELIAIRVARGESVVPAKPKKQKTSKVVPDDTSSTSPVEQVKDKEIDWQKWGERAARGFAWAEGGKRIFKGDLQWAVPRSGSLEIPFPVGQGQETTEMEVSTYPAQHIASPGLLTLTSSSLSFTQVLSSQPKVQIPLDHIRGVKKTGKLGGLTLRWGESEGEEREEKFRWVGGRDEVFGKLIGWRGRRWIHI